MKTVTMWVESLSEVAAGKGIYNTKTSQKFTVVSSRATGRKQRQRQGAYNLRPMFYEVEVTVA